MLKRQKKNNRDSAMCCADQQLVQKDEEIAELKSRLKKMTDLVQTSYTDALKEVRENNRHIQKLKKGIQRDSGVQRQDEQPLADVAQCLQNMAVTAYRLWSEVSGEDDIYPDSNPEEFFASYVLANVPITPNQEGTLNYRASMIARLDEELEINVGVHVAIQEANAERANFRGEVEID